MHGRFNGAAGCEARHVGREHEPSAGGTPAQLIPALFSGRLALLNRHRVNQHISLCASRSSSGRLCTSLCVRMRFLVARATHSTNRMYSAHLKKLKSQEQLKPCTTAGCLKIQYQCHSHVWQKQNLTECVLRMCFNCFNVLVVFGGYNQSPSL